VPPGTGWLSVVADPTHTVKVPVIAAGDELTVTCVIAVHPAAPVLTNDMFDVPAVTPVTIPVVPPTVAFAVTLLLHVPGVPALLNVVVPPMHIASLPVFAERAAFTVTVVVLAHPFTPV